MTDLFAARSQMAMALAFHIVFASIGMAMPLFMVLAEAAHLRTGDPVYRTLAKKWSKGVSMLFAVGAVSGTVLSFELGLLWPAFMKFAGPIVGMPFSLEGFAFFLEAIFLGIWLYAWDRVRPSLHLLSGVGVLLSGLLSAVFVICANGWMNTPTGFVMEDGKVVSIDPIAAMFNPSAIPEGLHMVAAAFAAVGFLVAGIHAWYLLKSPTDPFHRRALTIAMCVAVPGAFLTPMTAHLAAQAVAHNQPVKLAAMEARWETGPWAPFTIGGIPDEVTETTSYKIEIPGLLSVLSFDDPNAVVQGLKDFPKDLRPPGWPVHLAFQIMVGCGMTMMTVGGFFAGRAAYLRALPTDRWLLWAIVGCTPLGMIAIEAGWTVTEVGRQPWVVTGFLRTADAVTPQTGLWLHLLGFSALYLVLAFVVARLMVNLVSSTDPSVHPKERH
jgi:cytochrome bd ubiquinol oxidase subunit I